MLRPAMEEQLQNRSFPVARQSTRQSLAVTYTDLALAVSKTRIDCARPFRGLAPATGGLPAKHLHQPAVTMKNVCSRVFVDNRYPPANGHV